MRASELAGTFPADRHKAAVGNHRQTRSRSREARVKIVHVLVVCAAFVALLGAASFFSVRMTAPAPQPEATAAQSAASRGFFALPDGKNCRQVLFDRDTSDIIESVTRPCDSIAHGAAARPPYAPIRSEFSWGKK